MSFLWFVTRLPRTSKNTWFIKKIAIKLFKCNYVTYKNGKIV